MQHSINSVLEKEMPFKCSRKKCVTFLDTYYLYVCLYLNFFFNPFFLEASNLPITFQQQVSLLLLIRILFQCKIAKSVFLGQKGVFLACHSWITVVRDYSTPPRAIGPYRTANVIW